MTIIGTSYFPSLSDAEIYYSPYSPDLSNRDFNSMIQGKIQSGEIYLGKPPLKPGESFFVKENRYFVQSKD